MTSPHQFIPSTTFQSLHARLAGPLCQAGVVLFASFLLQSASSAELTASSIRLKRFEFTRAQMGMPVRITLYAESESTATRAAQTVYDHIRQLNRLLSDYEDDSELTLLSKTSGQARWVPVSDTLWEVLSAAQNLSRRSQGAFDVTVGPITSLWRRARRDRRLPEPGRLRQALESVGYEKLRLSASRQAARLDAPNMRLDLGGIAKGFALDEALRVLNLRGIRRAIVFAGGDMAASEPPPGQPGWRIELAPLDAPGAPPKEFVWLRQSALATSGDLFQHVVIDGARYSHIVDPKTGIGLTDHSLVTVVARRAMLADSLATALSVLGPEPGLRLIRSYRGVDARITRKPFDSVEHHESPGFRRHLIR